MVLDVIQRALTVPRFVPSIYRKNYEQVKKQKKTVLIPALFRSRGRVLTHRNPAGDVEYGDDNVKSLILRRYQIYSGFNRIGQ